MSIAVVALLHADATGAQASFASRFGFEPDDAFHEAWSSSLQVIALPCEPGVECVGEGPDAEAVVVLWQDPRAVAQSVGHHRDDPRATALHRFLCEVVADADVDASEACPAAGR